MLDLGAPPSGLQARALGPAEVAACLELSTEAGWNQTARDWLSMLAIGRGAGLFDRRLVGSAVAVPYAAVVAGRRPIGFVSMVLVTPTWQRRGLATWLTERCARDLESHGLTPVLDATPAGQGIYRRLGFAGGITLDRWHAAQVDRRAAIEHVALPAGIALRPVADVASIVEIDARAFGAIRAPMLADLLARRPDLAWAAHRGDTIVGFVLGRDGRAASQVGPAVADDDATAAALLAQALARVAGPAIVDLPRARERLASTLAAAGFAAVRPFVRMHRGDAPPVAAALAATAGPELG